MILALLRQAMLDLIFPPACRVCQEPLDQGSSRFCQGCILRLEAEREQPGCPRCGKSVAPFEVSANHCAECRDRDLRILGVARIGEHFGCLAEMVRAYKYHNQEQFETILGGLLIEAVARAPWFDRIEVVVPVPSHWIRRLRRPVRPAEALADMLASSASWPCVRLLRRVMGGRHQVGLGYSERLHNIRGAFALRAGFKLRRTRVLLVDDVRTTGATLEECARVLCRAGAAEVYAAVAVTAASAESTEKTKQEIGRRVATTDVSGYTLG